MNIALLRSEMVAQNVNVYGTLGKITYFWKEIF